MATTIGGRYRVLEELGRGGMAIVYRVEDLRTGAALALKRGVASTHERRARRQALLAREYHTLAQLAHPRIIEVYDYGVDEDGPYYVMELLDGGDLDKSAALPFREVCALLRDVASSLAILHARGLIHRDVSTRNVRRTADGRAKLIDFGTMTSMGVALEAVGTPPFMAPEVLQLQTLDARADLFALGALGYRLLTGKHAYPVRRIRELRDAWRTRPAAPIRVAPETPGALSELLMQLLALDRNARPHSAAEVISRLCAIADLPFEENVAVSKAYLTTPVLIGREQALVTVRKCLLALGRGDGGALLIEGNAGTGRTRLLDACAIEAKLLGASVVRADAAEVEPGDFAVMRALFAQLRDLLPNEVEAASRLAHPALASVLDVAPAPSDGPPPERSLLVRELRELVLALTREQRLLLAVDNFDACDAASVAVLAALACKTERHALVVTLVVDRQSAWATSPVRRLLQAVSQPVAVDDLSERQAEALLRSVFGDVANLALIAGRIHAIARGNPRTTMELAQHLVGNGRIRHEAGAFSLPDTLDERDLPSTLLSSLRERFAALSSDARELCHVVLVTESDAFGLGDYERLASHGDAARVFAAIAELIAARVLVVEGDRCRFSQRGFAAVAGESMRDDRAAVLHAKVARLLGASGGEVLRRAHHLLESGTGEGEALELLAAVDWMQQHAPLPLLERALAAADRAKHRTRFDLRMALLQQAQALPDVARFRAHLPPFVERLERDSGLMHYRALGHLPEVERLAAALAAASAEHDATPERERGYTVSEAIRLLCQLSAMFNSIATWTFDVRSWDEMPSLEPLEALSPAIGLLNRFADATRGFVEGRFITSSAAQAEVLERVSLPDRAGLEAAVQAGMQLGLHMLLGLRNAALGLAVAEDHARELEKDGQLRVAAWRVRQLFFTARGDTAEAHRCMRRAELLQLQLRGEQYGLGATLAAELPLAVLSGDLHALQPLTERVASIAESLPGWRPLALLGQSRLRLLQGDAEGALALLMPAFELAPPGRHWCFILLCENHLAVLNGLGRFDEAIATARHYLDVLKQQDITLVFYGSHVILQYALALSSAGVHDKATYRAESVIATVEQIGTIGLLLGHAYETRARVALAAGDIATFERYVERCAHEYGSVKNAVLAARLARLVAEARSVERGSAGPLPLLDELSTEASQSEYVTVASRMRECPDPSDRARCVLTILLQHIECFGGYLYGLGQDGPALLAGLPSAEAEPELEAWLRQWVEGEIAAFHAEPVTVRGGSSHPPARRRDHYVDGEHRRFEPLLVYGELGAETRAAAVLVADVTSGRRRGCDRELLALLARELLERGDVSGVPLNAAPN